MTPPVVLAEVDLDAAPPAPQTPRRNPLLPALVLTVVLGLVGGAVLRSAVTDPPVPNRPAVTAWVSLVAVEPGGTQSMPGGVLAVTVANRGDADLAVTDVEVTGRRVVRAPASPRAVTVPGGGVTDLRLTVPLACVGTTAPPGAARDPGVAVRLTVSGGSSVEAAPVGDLALADGACRVVARTLPDGAGRPVAVETSSFTAGRGSVRVAGLPAGAVVVAVYADGIPLASGGSVVADGAGRATLPLALPESFANATGERGVVPVGLQLRVQTGDGLTTRYAATGPELARWLLAGRAAFCAKLANEASRESAGC